MADRMVPCPQCRESIPVEAIVCSHCQRFVSWRAHVKDAWPVAVIYSVILLLFVLLARWFIASEW
jgi:hypothetical protein